MMRCDFRVTRHCYRIGASGSSPSVHKLVCARCPCSHGAPLDAGRTRLHQGSRRSGSGSDSGPLSVQAPSRSAGDRHTLLVEVPQGAPWSYLQVETEGDSWSQGQVQSTLGLEIEHQAQGPHQKGAWAARGPLGRHTQGRTCPSGPPLNFRSGIYSAWPLALGEGGGHNKQIWGVA